MYILSTKADDYIGKNSGIDEVLYRKNKVVDTFKINRYKEFNKKNETSFLQKKLDYSVTGEDSFVPEGAKFETVKTIAGKDSDVPIRDIDRLVNNYGGKPDDWKKQLELIESDKYKFDIHWYECDSVQYDVKLKRRSVK